MRNFDQSYERKTHLFHDQQGAEIPHSNGKLFGDTLCKINSRSPEMLTTTDPDKVTCKICRKDARFRMLLGQKRININSQYGKMAEPGLYLQMVGRGLRPGFVNGMRTRHRRNWRGKLILQVEASVPYNYDPATDNHEPQYMGQWRDATLEDMGGGVV